MVFKKVQEGIKFALFHTSGLPILKINCKKQFYFIFVVNLKFS